MKRVTAVFAVVGVLATGILIGVLATHLFYAHQLAHRGGPPGMVGRMFSGQLEHRLDLSAQQTERVREILQRSHEEAAALRHDTFPRVREIMDRATREIEEVLTAEQREKFRELRRSRGRWAEQYLLGTPGEHGHRGPGPRHPRPGRKP